MDIMSDIITKSAKHVPSGKETKMAPLQSNITAADEREINIYTYVKRITIRHIRICDDCFDDIFSVPRCRRFSPYWCRFRWAIMRKQVGAREACFTFLHTEFVLSFYTQKSGSSKIISDTTKRTGFSWLTYLTEWKINEVKHQTQTHLIIILHHLRINHKGLQKLTNLDVAKQFQFLATTDECRGISRFESHRKPALNSRVPCPLFSLTRYNNKAFCVKFMNGLELLVFGEQLLPCGMIIARKPEGCRRPSVHNEIDSWPPNLLPLDQQVRTKKDNDKCVIHFETASPGRIPHAMQFQINPQENFGTVIDNSRFVQPRRCQSVEVITYPVHIHQEPSPNTSHAVYQQDFLKDTANDPTFLKCPVYLDPFDKCLVQHISNKDCDNCEIPTVSNEASNQYYSLLKTTDRRILMKLDDSLIARWWKNNIYWHETIVSGTNTILTTTRIISTDNFVDVGLQRTFMKDREKCMDKFLVTNRLNIGFSTTRRAANLFRSMLFVFGAHVMSRLSAFKYRLNKRSVQHSAGFTSLEDSPNNLCILWPRCARQGSWFGVQIILSGITWVTEVLRRQSLQDPSAAYLNDPSASGPNLQEISSSRIDLAEGRGSVRTKINPSLINKIGAADPV
ncbi:hypothetical protein CLF_108352 [Clonorchis sinensis]|uniref:Uncharacterized protein n=1 Tax=Clonorchis sinensis TaxID=79923 RepID=G7YRJ5_CLOSI|nr:hypothetical protein CLF_108352 [Clonorchis sinensis]